MTEDGEGQAGAFLGGVDVVGGVEEVVLDLVEAGVEVAVETRVVQGAVFKLPVLPGIAPQTPAQRGERLRPRGREGVQRAVAAASLEEAQQRAAGRYVGIDGIGEHRVSIRCGVRGRQRDFRRAPFSPVNRRFPSRLPRFSHGSPTASSCPAKAGAPAAEGYREHGPTAPAGTETEPSAPVPLGSVRDGARPGGAPRRGSGPPTPARSRPATGGSAPSPYPASWGPWAGRARSPRAGPRPWCTRRTAR